MKAKIISYGDLKKMGKIPLALPEDRTVPGFDEINLFNYHNDDAPVAYIDGDLNIEGNLVLDSFFVDLFAGHEEKFDFRKKGYSYTSLALVWISGGLQVSNAIASMETEDYSEILVVEQDVKAKSVIQGGFTHMFLRDLSVTQIHYCQQCAEGWESVFGKRNQAVTVDNNFVWRFRNLEAIKIRDDASLITLQKMFVAPHNYFGKMHEGEEPDLFFEEEGEYNLMQDILDDKLIFRKEVLQDN